MGRGRAAHGDQTSARLSGDVIAISGRLALTRIAEP